MRVSREEPKQPVKGTIIRDGVAAGEVKPTFTRRMSTGYPDLDRVFGTSKRYDAQGKTTHTESGLAVGKVYLLCGQSGLGKTTLYTELMIKFVEEGKRCGVAVMEMSKEEYMEQVLGLYHVLGVKPVNLATHLTLFEGTNHMEHCVRLKELQLDWMVWDSFGMLDGSTGEKAVKKIVRDIKDAVIGRCNGLLIGHLKDDGTVKGNKRVLELSDSLFTLQAEPSQPHEHPDEGIGRMSLRSKKNRGGASDEVVYCRRRAEEIVLLEGYRPLAAPQS